MAESEPISMRQMRCAIRPSTTSADSISPMLGGGFQCPQTWSATVCAGSGSPFVMTGATGAFSERTSSAAPRFDRRAGLESPPRVATMARPLMRSAPDVPTLGTLATLADAMKKQEFGLLMRT